MTFWTAFAVVAIVAITTEFIIRIVKLGTSYCENIERIRHGYPTLDGTITQKAPETKEGYHN